MTADESATHAHGQHERALDATAARRVRHQIAIAEMRLMAEQARELKTTDGDREARLLDGQAADEQAAHDRIPDPVERPPAPGTVAVFACEDHLIDAEKASHLHQSDCLTSDTCACETVPPEPSAWPFPEIHPAMAAKGWS